MVCFKAVESNERKLSLFLFQDKRYKNKAKPPNFYSTQNRPYDEYLGRFLSHICQTSSNQDTALFQFMIDLPEIPVTELKRLEGMCLNIDQ